MEFSTANETATAERDIQPLPEYRDRYRTAHITESFDWPTILDTVADDSGLEGLDKVYLVVFRSVRRHDLTQETAQEISRLDRAAHVEALGSQALLHYFAGDIDTQGQAMSWCLWTDSQAARQALSGENHKKAAAQADNFYQEFSIELYNVRRYSDPILFIPAERLARHH